LPSRGKRRSFKNSIAWKERDSEFMKNAKVGTLNALYALIFNLNIRGLGGGTKARYLRRCKGS